MSKAILRGSRLGAIVGGSRDLAPALGRRDQQHIRIFLPDSDTSNILVQFLVRLLGRHLDGAVAGRATQRKISTGGMMRNRDGQCGREGKREE